MCGIAGYVSRTGVLATFRSDLTGALDAIRHRGPDDWGIWDGEQGVGLGHRRLSILDLSPHGHQPMVSTDGRLVMIFNGEVYNFKLIRKELESLGHRFRGTGDTEVILAAFQEWDFDEAVKRFIGMFAIAVWDRKVQRLVLLRDRLGVKPLYYGFDGHTLWFGSELKALRAFSHWRPEIDQAALAEYFQFGYINAPRTIYRHVWKLPPGHLLEIEMGGEPRVRPYWSVLDGISNTWTSSEDSLAEELEALMVDAFKLRMVSDVPVGMFLSGGVDSSLVTALLQKHLGESVHTFTIGFKEARYNEAPHARRLAEYLGTNHTERILDPNEAKAIVPRWGELYDEPFADSSGIPTFLVSQVASEQVKVVLSADGGDELFSGYNAYGDLINKANRLERLPAPAHRLLRGLLEAVPIQCLQRTILDGPFPYRARSWAANNLLRRLARIRDYMGAETSGGLYERGLSQWHPRELRRLIGSVERVRESPDIYPGGFAEQMCLWDLHNYLPGDILAKVDRATMAVSIEGREPLLDHRLVEFAFRLPLSMRRGVLGSKHLLRKILYKHVPREMVERPKQGFGVPVLEWLRGDLHGLMDRHLSPEHVQAQGILDPGIVSRTLRDFDRGDNSAVTRVWSLLAFQMWRQKWG